MNVKVYLGNNLQEMLKSILETICNKCQCPFRDNLHEMTKSI